MADLSLTVQESGGLLVVDSRLIAARLGIQHESFIKTVRKYRSRVESKFGHIRFEIGTVTNSVGATNEVVFALLTEPQSTAIMTFSKNTDQVVDCKLALIEAFEKAKEIIKTVIPAQSDRIRELELENENLKLRDKLLDRQDLMMSLHGRETVLVLMGKADQVVEIDRPTIEVIDDRHNIKFSGQTLKQVAEHLQKKYGAKFKSGAELKRKLEQIGRSDLVGQTPRTILADYVPEENLDEVYRLLTSGDRQQLIGE